MHTQTYRKTHTHTCTRTHAHTHTHPHTHTHTYSHTKVRTNQFDRDCAPSLHAHKKIYNAQDTVSVIQKKTNEPGNQRNMAQHDLHHLRYIA